MPLIYFGFDLSYLQKMPSKFFLLWVFDFGFLQDCYDYQVNTALPSRLTQIWTIIIPKVDVFQRLVKLSSKSKQGLGQSSGTEQHFHWSRILLLKIALKNSALFLKYSYTLLNNSK